MPTVNPTCYHLSASSIASFKACPMRFRLAYREGLRPDRDTDSQRVGTNWHKLHEVYARAIGRFLCIADSAAGEELTVSVSEFALAAVVEHLNQTYADVPQWIDANDWAIERQILLTSFIAYLWYWQNDPVTFLASELPFNLPLHEPKTGMPLSMKSVQRVGKVDHIVQWHDGICALERKSTSKSIAPDSDYWQKSQKDTQVSMYALAFQDLRASGQLPFEIPPNRQFRYGNTLYDVWKKPTIQPSMLTQAKTAEFLKTRVYCDQSFTVEAPTHTGHPDGFITAVTVNGVTAEMNQGKKAISIRETPEMFGARLLQDVYARPDFYFARREIARTEAELSEFRRELFGVYQSQRIMEDRDIWFSNESQCRATFTCQYVGICYGAGARSVCDGTAVPAGFRRIFADFRVNGHELEA